MWLPPLLLRVRVRPGSRWLPGLWLPVVLLWPLVAVLLVPLLALAGLVALVLGYGRTFAQVVAGLYAMLCALSGTRVDIVSGRHKVFIGIW